MLQTGGHGRSRVAFGLHGAASDGRDTAADSEADGAADRAHGTDRDGRDATGHDPADTGAGGSGHDRWVIAWRDHSIARGIGATCAIGGPNNGAWCKSDRGGCG